MREELRCWDVSKCVNRKELERLLCCWNDRNESEGERDLYGILVTAVGLPSSPVSSRQ